MRTKSLLLLAVPLYCMAASLHATTGQQDLRAIYMQLKPVLAENIYGIPVYIHSKDQNNTMTGVIYGVLQHPFKVVSHAIRSANNWCKITPQHLNIKACTYQSIDDRCQLNFYSGRKFYERADDVYQLAYRFVIQEQGKDFFHLSLSADEGPLGTHSYRLNIKAMPLDKTRSFIYFSYAYQYNFITRIGMNAYLATLGSDKLGFSISGQDTQDNPVYIKGVRGIIERNSVRYYLAIQSYLDTLHIPTDDRFSARLNKWFELTEHHHRQLYEMNKQDYLQYKHQERKDQQRLQAAITQSPDHSRRCH